MSKICQITGKYAKKGNYVSHANNKTKRSFKVNLSKKKFFLPSSKEWITLKISSHGIRIINKLGIEQALKKSKYYKLLKSN